MSKEVKNEENEVPMSIEELKKHLNIPPRDEKKYPVLSKDDEIAVGMFLYQISLVSELCDGNLSSLIWNMYKKISDYLKDDLNNLDDLKKVLDEIKTYIKESQLPLFVK